MHEKDLVRLVGAREICLDVKILDAGQEFEELPTTLPFVRSM